MAVLAILEFMETVDDQNEDILFSLKASCVAQSFLKE